jgi:hypothetical protein
MRSFERCHLKTLGEWSLQFELSYFRLDPVPYPLLDLQHEVNCRILEEFRRAGIQFALPPPLAPRADRRRLTRAQAQRMFHVMLFEPEIPPNTGNVIRLCANSGARLHLVQPLGFRLDDRSLRRSGLDYHDLADVSVHADLQSCLGQLGKAASSPSRLPHGSATRTCATAQPTHSCSGPRPAACRPRYSTATRPRSLRVDPDAQGKPQPQPVECRVARDLRGLAAARLRDA